MKLKEYLTHLNNLVKENPESLEMDVVSSADDEGNYYNHVHFHPSLGHYDGDSFNSNVEVDEGEEPLQINAICIN